MTKLLDSTQDKNGESLKDYYSRNRLTKNRREMLERIRFGLTEVMRELQLPMEGGEDEDIDG